MTFDRRRFLNAAAALGVAGVLAPAARVLAQPRFRSAPFALGVASGYPHANGVTLWTRVTGDPSDAPMRSAVDVAWEVGADESFRAIVADGKTQASPAW